MAASPIVTAGEDELGRPVLRDLPTGPTVLAAALGQQTSRGEFVAAMTTAGELREQDSIPQVEDE